MNYFYFPYSYEKKTGMALQGWRLCGVTVTIVIYIGGVLFLSMKNVPGSHPKRTRIERFAEVNHVY